MFDDVPWTVWQIDYDRIVRVATKLAIGHVAYEIHPVYAKPATVEIALLPNLSHQTRDAFETVTLSPRATMRELGSRSFMRLYDRWPDNLELQDGWLVVQDGQYRYAVIEENLIIVRVVIGECFAYEAIWEEFV